MQKQKKIANQLKESDIRYYSSPEAQELARLKEAISRTDEEKFIYLMNLMKLQKTMAPTNR